MRHARPPLAPAYLLDAFWPWRQTCAPWLAQGVREKALFARQPSTSSTTETPRAACVRSAFPSVAACIPEKERSDTGNTATKPGRALATHHFSIFCSRCDRSSRPTSNCQSSNRRAPSKRMTREGKKNGIARASATRPGACSLPWSAIDNAWSPERLTGWMGEGRRCFAHRHGRLSLPARIDCQQDLPRLPLNCLYGFIGSIVCR